MIIFRPHRGSLEEAMKEAVEFATEDLMKDHIVAQWEGSISKEDIVIDDKVVNDERNGWKNTRCVCTKRIGLRDYIKRYGCPQCIGMCATDYK